LKTEYDVAVEWRPFELHPEIPPEGMELSPYLRAYFAGTTERLKQMAHEVGLEIVFSDWIPNSRRALEASEYAREQSQHEAFHRVVFRRFYGEGQDLGSWVMLRAAAEEVGLDPDAMQHQTETGQYRAVVDAHFAEARRLGITGVPVYIFDDKYAIVGARPYETFQEVMTLVMTEAGDGTKA
jgi:predicted DsbA family dithiol-disulfide isomerase